MISEWGWNPATTQAVGAIATLGTLMAALLAMRHSRQSAQAAQESADAARAQVETFDRESRLRMRPWLGLTGVHLVRRGRQNATDGTEVTRPPDLEAHYILIKYKNIGAIPAANMNLDLPGLISSGEGTEHLLPLDDLRDIYVGTIFPDEDSYSVIRAERGHGLDSLLGDVSREAGVLRTNATRFTIRGRFKYEGDNSSYVTNFEASFDPDQDIFTTWRNTDAT